MSIVIIGIVGITSVLLAVQLKGTKSEYGIYLVMAAGCFMFFYGAARLESIVEGMRRLQDYVKIRPVFLNTLVKMTGITYITEFSSGICRDAGYGAVGTQIEIFGKLAILAVSMPVVLALMETLQGFLG